MKPAPAAMTEQEYRLLDDWISGEFGISFPEHKREVLEARLRPRLQSLALSGFGEYYRRLAADANGERERLAELVTNNESFFFRETHQFEALFAEAWSELRQTAAAPGPLRLLCAGCSSGEEPYTLAIFARRSALGLAGAAPAIDAFDLDGSRVEMARRAEYGRGSLRSLAPGQVEQYFAPAGAGRWTLRPPYRGGIRFSRGNILDPASFAAPVAYDAVFCRNVLIYFSPAAVVRAARHFAAALRPGGLLFLGASESILGLSEEFETVRFARATAYRRLAR
jgi:chemotaxis protein methyltransferase CheR